VAKLEVLVVGATGVQGSAVTRALLRVGHRVRAHVRSLAHPEAERLRQRGARLAWAELDDEPRIREAMAGVDAVFAVPAPAGRPQAEARHGLMLVEAARSLGVPHFVWSSLMSPTESTGEAEHESRHEVERYLRTVGIPHTVLLPGFFMENLQAEGWLGALRAGRLLLPLSPTRKLQQVAVADLARFVRLVMERSAEFHNRRVCVASDELTPLEMAATLARVVGQAIQHVPGECPPGHAGLMPLFGMLERQAGCADVAALRADYPEVNWHTLDGWAKRQDWTA
jgi:uncharacterized protein YbjT (DUF2867 family)